MSTHLVTRDLYQEIDCNPENLTLYFKYRSGYTDAEGIVMAMVWRIAPTPQTAVQKNLNTNEPAWVDDSLLITFSATTIRVIFRAAFDSTQWLDVDDVYIE